jgi:hypothetical protein
VPNANPARVAEEIGQRDVRHFNQLHALPSRASWFCASFWAAANAVTPIDCSHWQAGVLAGPASISHRYDDHDRGAVGALVKDPLASTCSAACATGLAGGGDGQSPIISGAGSASVRLATARTVVAPGTEWWPIAEAIQLAPSKHLDQDPWPRRVTGAQ